MPKLFGCKIVVKKEVTEKVTRRVFDFLSVVSLTKVAETQKKWRTIVNTDFPFNLIHQHFPELHPLRVKRLGGGATNITTYIQLANNEQVGRVPGKDTDKFLNRAAEAKNVQIAFEHGAGPEILQDDAKGLQRSKFLPNPITMTSELLTHPDNIKKSIVPLKRIHQCGKQFGNPIDVFKRNKDFLQMLEEQKKPLAAEFKNILTEVEKLEKIFAQLDIKKVPCHNDPTPGNFVESNGNIILIDWEYSGNNDFVWDLVGFAIESEFSSAQEKVMFAAYFGDQPDEAALQRYVLYKPVYALWGIVWALLQLANGNNAAPVDVLTAMVQKRSEDFQGYVVSADYNNVLATVEAALLKQKNANQTTAVEISRSFGAR